MNADPIAFAEAIHAITGAAPVPCPDTYGVDGPTPQWEVFPVTDDQVAGLLALAESQKLAVVPRGGGTRDRLGGALRQADLILSTARLDRMIEYNPADLTVTVGAGMSLLALNETLAGSGQRLPLDPPGARLATVGGVVASAAAGPARLAYGSPRDQVLGMRVALTSGFAVKCGGRVVKNVAGYDLVKLFTGSMGTLGVITEISFKVRPLPDQRRTVVLAFPDLSASIATGGQVVHSELTPAALELVAPALAAVLSVDVPGDGLAYLVAIRLEDTPAAVAHQVERLQSMARRAGAADLTVLQGTREERFWRQCTDFSLYPGMLAVLKASLPLTAVAAFADQAESAATAAGLAAPLLGGLGTGVVRVGLVAPPGDRTPESPHIFAAGQVCAALAATAAGAGGSLVVEAAPAAVKAQVDVWGPAGPALAQMRSIKDRFDPAGVLNPGRFVGGI